jgi:hypothetical protein
MGQARRKLLVGAVLAVGVVVVILGIGGLREFLEIGKVPPEILGRRLGYTVGSLAFGLGMIVWCFVAGIRWAYSPGSSRRR